MATIIKTIKRVLKIERPPENTAPPSPAPVSAEPRKTITITRKVTSAPVLLTPSPAPSPAPERRTLSIKRKPATPEDPTKARERPVKATESTKKATPQPAKEKGPAKTPKKPKTPPSEVKMWELEGYMVEAYKTWREYHPLAVGIFPDVRRIATGKGYSVRVAEKLIDMHTKRTKYVQALAQGGQRFRLDGTPDGEVTAEQRGAAAQRLARRVAKSERVNSDEAQAGKCQ